MARRDSNNGHTGTGGTVAGLFYDRLCAESAIQQLKEAGFLERQIGVAARDREQQQDIAEGTGTHAAGGAKTGALSGGVVGGVVGLLAGIGALAIPGIGPILAGGALASTLAGAGVGAAAGGLLGALVGLGISEQHARHFVQGFDKGGILLTVQADGRSPLALEILAESGGDTGPAHELRGNGNRSEDIERRHGNESASAYDGPERRMASRR